MRCLAASICGPSSSRFSSHRRVSCAVPPISALRFGAALRPLRLKIDGNSPSPSPARAVASSCSSSSRASLRAQQPRLLHQPLVRLARLAQFVRVVARQNEIAHEIQQQRVENLETVRVVHEIRRAGRNAPGTDDRRSRSPQTENGSAAIRTSRENPRRKAPAAISKACLLPLRARSGTAFRPLRGRYSCWSA